MSLSIGKKSGYATYEAAEKAALAIKGRYPQLQVAVLPHWENADAQLTHFL
ncbi:MAG: hypothetical protein WCD69_27500 [Xanthobacteraceae bacterium]